jgi:hypothetical protein
MIRDRGGLKRHLDMGVRDFCMGGDMTTLYTSGSGARVRRCATPWAWRRILEAQRAPAATARAEARE